MYEKIIAYLRHGGCEHNNLIKFTDSFHKLIHTRPLDHIDIMIITLDLNRDCEICLV